MTYYNSFKHVLIKGKHIWTILCYSALAIICTGCSLDKYSRTNRFQLQDFTDAKKSLGSNAGSNLCNGYFGIVNSAIARSTWTKYSSALNTFACFEADSRKVFTWPLPITVCRAFVVWGSSVRNLSHATIKSYLSAIKFVHTIRGFHCEYISKDATINLLLTGISKIGLSRPSNNTRRVVTIPLLITIGSRIARSPWDPLTKQVFWCAATTSFFGSLRLGEILAPSENSHSPVSDLTWNDIKASSPSSILIRIKQPKSGEKEEYVDLFPFPTHDLCPVAALKNLQKKQEEAGVYDKNSPVFRFGSGKNLTMTHFNYILSELLSDMCQPGISKITCHSFRAGIPSTISLFPELATSDLIKGWGRWASDCYSRYTRLKLPQKHNIFQQISGALRTLLPSRSL
jgi:hypothetical protein